MKVFMIAVCVYCGGGRVRDLILIKFKAKTSIGHEIIKK